MHFLQARLEKLAKAVLVYVPLGSMKPGDQEEVDVHTLMERTGFTRKEIEGLASSIVLAKLVGVTKTSFIKPTTEDSKDQGAVRLKAV